MGVKLIISYCKLYASTNESLTKQIYIVYVDNQANIMLICCTYCVDTCCTNKVLVIDCLRSLEWYDYSLRANLLARSVGQVNLDSNK